MIALIFCIFTIVFLFFISELLLEDVFKSLIYFIKKDKYYTKLSAFQMLWHTLLGVFSGISALTFALALIVIFTRGDNQ